MPIRHWLVFCLATANRPFLFKPKTLDGMWLPKWRWNPRASRIRTTRTTMPRVQVGAGDLIELFIYFGNPLGFQISD